MRCSEVVEKDAGRGSRIKHIENMEEEMQISGSWRRENGTARYMKQIGISFLSCLLGSL